MPIDPQPSWRDGMRSLHPDEFGSLCELVGTVFRPGLAEEYPHFYTPAHAGEMRVVVVDGRVVSHIGALRRNASLFGCTARASSLGGVATYEEHRGSGYATALFEDTMRVCREDGVDFMLVSGYRKMYHRFGCRYVGRDWNFSLTAERAGDFDDDDVELIEGLPGRRARDGFGLPGGARAVDTAPFRLRPCLQRLCHEPPGAGVQSV